MPETFAACLKRLREEHACISQAALAKQSDFDHSFISRLEAGKRDPSRGTVLTLAGALGCDDRQADELLVAAGFLPSEATVVERAAMLLQVDVDLLRRLAAAVKAGAA